MPLAPKRTFLIGCPRSGTTLLQSLLAAHSDIASFPETHAFPAILGDRSPWRRKLGLVSPGAKDQLEAFLREIGHEEMRTYLPRTSLTRQYAQAFIKILDLLTQLQHKSLWLEKTPGHIYYIGYIEQRVKGAKFIHLLRNGADVVASLYEVTQNHPQMWQGSWSIDRCIAQWCKDVQISLRYCQNHNHILVKYERLVDNPRAVVQELCQWLNIPFQETMLEEYKLAARQVVLPNEPWKAAVNQGIHSANGKKFYQLFNEEQRNYILHRLENINLEAPMTSTVA